MKKITIAMTLAAAAVAAHAACPDAALNKSIWWNGTKAQVNTIGWMYDYGTDGTDGCGGDSQPGKDMGYWFDYDDRSGNSHGGSSISYPFPADEYNDMINPMIAKLGYLSVFFNLTDPTLTGQQEEWPFNFAGMGFNVVNGKKETFDISATNGLCVTYTSDHPVTWEIEDPVAGDHACFATLEAATTVTPAKKEIAEFKEPADWGKNAHADCSEAFKQASGIKFKFENKGVPVSGKFRLFEIGPAGTCTGAGAIGSEPATYSNVKPGSTPAAIAAVKAPAAMKAVLSGRTLSFSGIATGAKYEIVSLQGQVVKSGVVSSSVSLSSLNAGIYMVRVSGKAVNMNQKIILK